MASFISYKCFFLVSLSGNPMMMSTLFLANDALCNNTTQHFLGNQNPNSSNYSFLCYWPMNALTPAAAAADAVNISVLVT